MRHLTRRTLALALGLAATAPLLGAGWCDLPFKDVAEYADAVLLARYSESEADVVSLPIVEVLRGTVGVGTVRMDPLELGPFDPHDGMGFLVAVDAEGRPVRALAEIGLCSPISILPLHRGKLRPRFREGYDGRSRPISLDSLRSELAVRASAAPSVGTRSVASGY